MSNGYGMFPQEENNDPMGDLRKCIAKLEAENVDLKQRLKNWNCGANSSAVLLAEKQRDMLAKGLEEQWAPIETLKLGGDAVLVFAECWKDPDFNPSGIREGFRNESDDGPIYSARWNDCHECWETDIGYEATHWMPRPKPPLGD